MKSYEQGNKEIIIDNYKLKIITKTKLNEEKIEIIFLDKIISINKINTKNNIILIFAIVNLIISGLLIYLIFLIGLLVLIIGISLLSLFLIKKEEKIEINTSRETLVLENISDVYSELIQTIEKLKQK